SNPEVRETAFRILVEQPGTRNEQASVEHALRLIELGEFSETVISLIERTRETRAAPLLLRQIEKGTPLRERLIEIVGQVGHDDHVRWLVEHRKDYEPSEQVAVLHLVGQLPADEQLQLAREAARAENY